MRINKAILGLLTIFSCNFAIAHEVVCHTMSNPSAPGTITGGCTYYSTVTERTTSNYHLIAIEATQPIVESDYWWMPVSPTTGAQLKAWIVDPTPSGVWKWGGSGSLFHWTPAPNPGGTYTPHGTVWDTADASL